MRRTLWVLMLVFICALLSAGNSKSYRISRVVIDAAIQPDGSQAVTEQRTYAFHGHYHYAYRTFPKNGMGFHGFEIVENGVAYRQDASEKPGTFTVIDHANQTEVRWFFDAPSQTRSFSLRYLTNPCLESAQDAIILYYQYISDDWDLPQSNISLRVTPPTGTATFPVRAWLHGPLIANLDVAPDGFLSASCEELPRHRFLEIRAIYPHSLFSGLPHGAQPKIDAIVAEETQWAVKANQKREKLLAREKLRQERYAFGMKYFPYIPPFLILLFYFVLRTYGRRVRQDIFIEREISTPPRIAPAFVEYLLTRNITGGTVTATLFDLARRGVIDITEPGSGKKKDHLIALNRDILARTHLQPHETSLVKFLFDELGKGANQLTYKKIQKKQYTFMRFFNKWSKEIRKAGKELNWWDERSIRTRNWLFFADLLLVAGMVVLATQYGPSSLFVMVAPALAAPFAFLIAHRTFEGEVELAKVKAYKTYLKRLNKEKDPSGLEEQVGDAMVYGLVLGVGYYEYRKWTRHAAVYPQVFPWFHSSNPSPNSFCNAMTTMVQATGTTFSSASGAGGGASGGGGGGGSSGGGGAG
jgi:uncharacterized membrane protein